MLLLVRKYSLPLKFMQPLRTVTNYQCQYGTTTMQAIKLLYADGGWTRYYQGLTEALVQRPVSRFCDTAANVGILAFFENNPYMRTLPAFIQTAFASVVASCFRMTFSPVDMIKTIMQTPGQDSITLLRAKVHLRATVTISFSNSARWRCIAPCGMTLSLLPLLNLLITTQYVLFGLYLRFSFFSSGSGHTTISMQFSHFQLIYCRNTFVLRPSD